MTDFHAAQRAAGQIAWKTPAIASWESWVRDQWQQRNRAGAMLLNPLQEQSLWMRVIQRSQRDLLHPARLAEAAMRAYRLLCAYAPETLRTSARLGWSGDAAIFSSWIEDFEARGRRDGLISASRLVPDLTEKLQAEANGRIRLLLAGFDRILPTQESLLNAWGTWQQLELAESAKTAQFLAAPDPTTEAEACATWLREQLATNPQARLMVVATSLESRRGELERAFQVNKINDTPTNTEDLASEGLVTGHDWQVLVSTRTDRADKANQTNGALAPEALDFEFSMGVPLARVGVARSAVLLLRWLHEPITEPELDWLIGSGHLASTAEEEIALAKTMRQFRRDNQERMDWPIAEFASFAQSPSQNAETTPWPARLLAAQLQLRAEPERQSPLAWVSVAERLLESLNWPGFRPLTSLGFQAQDRWQRVLEECGSLGFDSSRVAWPEFVSTLADAVSRTIFAAESRDAAIQITGPLESAGQLADAIWFLGADEENWPGRGQPDPLLPIGLQRESGMPHASPHADWTLAAEATERLLSSANTVVFSYAKQAGGIELRPSRLVLQQAGETMEIAASSHTSQTDLTETYEDWTQLPFPNPAMAGGARTLTLQSLCPFQAFGTVRLGAEDWEPAEAGLSARQRGLLLHAVLHRAWAGTGQGGVRNHAELQAIPNLQQFVRAIVTRIMAENFDPAFRKHRNTPTQRFPQRYLELEAQRLTTLVTEWLEYERQRQPFTVAETEVKREITIAGLTLNLRLDRIDELADGQHLVIDYKTGPVGPRAWEGDRPDDVQLPLYATFAVPEALEGLVFARVRPGETQFSGRVRNASTSLLASLSPRSAIVQNPLDDRQLEDWREKIEQLGQDFLAGRALADPKDPQKTCQTCHLQAICRIRERITPLSDEESDDNSSEDESGGPDA